MLHRVGDNVSRTFAPNDFLTVTPEFLEKVILMVRDAGIETVSMDEACNRFKRGDINGRFACFTLDDGYLDNYQNAYPIFKKYEVPFTIYITSSFADGSGEFWWLALEEIISRTDCIKFEDGDTKFHIRCDTARKKYRTYDQIMRILWDTQQDRQREIIRGLAAVIDFDIAEHCRSLAMDWEILEKLAKDPLVTLGAHTRRHYALSRLTREEAQDEILSGARKMELEISVRPEHFCFPYGDNDSAGPRDYQLVRNLNFKSAVTTRKGLLFPFHSDHLYALPRVSLNGNFQSPIHVSGYLSGLPFAMINRFRPVGAKDDGHV